MSFWQASTHIGLVKASEVRKEMLLTANYVYIPVFVYNILVGPLVSTTTHHIRIRKCERCNKYKRVLFVVNDQNICEDCLRGLAFYETFKEGFKDLSLRGDVIEVGIDIGNITWLNPFAQCWYYPLLYWMFTKDTGIKCYYEDLKRLWKYKTPLDKVLKIYEDERIFKIINEDNKRVIVEGDALDEMYKKYGDRQDAYDIICAWVSGLIISRLHEEAEAPDFRAVNGIIKALAEKTVDAEGNIKVKPYAKTVSYRCRLCGARYSTADEVKRHCMSHHLIPSDEVMAYVEGESTIVGYLLELEYLFDVLEKEGVSPERFNDRMMKFGILVHRDPEVPWKIHQECKWYLIVSPAWIRVIARTKTRERELIRSYERAR
jgi:hypothetical protein